MSNIIGNRNSTPESGNSTLRPPSSRNLSSHQGRASADMSASSSHVSPLSARGIRPASEVFYNQSQRTQGGNIADDVQETAQQQWLADIDQSENTLEEMAAVTLDQDFKDELTAIEGWFRVLSEPERTAVLYALLQQTTLVQMRFFSQVLGQMAKTHPLSGILSPAPFAEKDPMSARMSDAMNKLNIAGGRNSYAFGSRPPPSPSAKRHSGLDPSTIQNLFPDAAAAIAKQKADYKEQTGTAAPSNRNSIIGDRSSQILHTTTVPEDPPMSPSPWNATRPTEGQQRPKSSSNRQPMGQFISSGIGGGLRSPRPDTDIRQTTVNALQRDPSSMLTPFSGLWSDATPSVPTFAQQAQQTEALQNELAMKNAALSTVQNRIQLDDAKKYRRGRSAEAQVPQAINTAQMPNGTILMTDENGNVLNAQQVASIQAQQLAVLHGMGSRPNSPGIALHSAGLAPVNLGLPINNGFPTTYNNQFLNAGLVGINQFPTGVGIGNEGYLSDHSDARGRSPRGRRGTSKPPEDPTDMALLSDIPAWLRTLRLHKYTDNLKDMKWQDLVMLDDKGLENKGVNALGARNKLLKTFEQVREAQGL